MKLKQLILIYALIAFCLTITLSTSTHGDPSMTSSTTPSVYCNRSLSGSISPVCQPADCGLYCMQEIPEGNAECQNRPDYPTTAKCCDQPTCDSSPGGACNGSNTLDPADPDKNGGNCVYSTSEDTSDFVCPNGWTHIPIGDPGCATGGSAEYGGAFKNAMCCCAPTIDTCNGRPPVYQPDYVMGSRPVLLDDTSTVWYASIMVDNEGNVDFTNSYGLNIEYEQPSSDTDSADQCVPNQPGQYGGIGVGGGGCDDVCELEDQCDSDECEPGTTCSDDDFSDSDVCCPPDGFGRDDTRNCCMNFTSYQCAWSPGQDDDHMGIGGWDCDYDSDCNDGLKCVDEPDKDFCCRPGKLYIPSKGCCVESGGIHSCDHVANGKYGGLGAGQGDCDDNCNLECDDDECSPGLHCDNEHCCDAETNWNDNLGCCATKFSHNPENYNGFIRIVKACNNGTVECGWIKRYGAGNYGVEFSAEYCDEGSQDNRAVKRTAINFSYVPQCARGGEEDDPKKFSVLMKVDKVWIEGGVRKMAPQFLNLTVVPGVYKVMGIDDSGLTNLRKEIIEKYEACRNTPTGCINPATGVAPPTEEAYYNYCTVYVLARSCDMPFNVNITNMCKVAKVEGSKNITQPYKDQVKEIGFTRCFWDIIDGGKFHDFPGVYIAVMNKSRHGANIGLLNYYVNALRPKGSTHMVNPGTSAEDNIRSVLSWNMRSVGRILGCRTDSNAFWSDKCGPGNFTCSIGAGLAYVYSQGFRASNLGNRALSSKCGYFEWQQPPTSRVPGQRADYFQWNDLDDEDDYDEYGGDEEDLPYERNFNSPWYYLNGETEKYDDQAFDFELGIPDRRYMVNESIESIRTNINATFVRYDSVQWKGVDYRYAWDLGCRPGTAWSKKYFYMPWGKGSGGDVDWVNGPWYGGTTYAYIDRRDVFSFKDYPTITEWTDEWQKEKTINNPIIYWDESGGPRGTGYFSPAATDRYWIISPSTTDYDEPEIKGTRPAHSGEDKETWQEPLYYSNPGGYWTPGDKPRQIPFNEGKNKDELKYYRQFNIRMLWANVFKVTPEFHNKPTRDDQCLPQDEEKMDAERGGLNIGWGDCDGDCNTEDVCAPGLKCVDVPWITTEFCCPAGYEAISWEKRCCKNIKLDTGNGCSRNDECPEGFACVQEGPFKDKCAKYDTDEGDCGPVDSCDNQDSMCLETETSDEFCFYFTAECSECDWPPNDRTPEGYLKRCQGDCDHDLNPSDPYTCDDDECAAGLHCDGTWFGPDFCCQGNTRWDATRGCCMECGVFEAELYDSDYCEYKTDEAKCGCWEGEGGCDDDDGYCEGDLKCVENTYGSTGLAKWACCKPGSSWNGYSCFPTSLTQPDTTIYTRTGGNSIYGEGGGGPIWFHFGAGGNLPNETEAGGTYDAIEYCTKVLHRAVEDCGIWGLLDGSDIARLNLNSFWNTDVCKNAWVYMRDQGGIWDEQKNLGDDKKTHQEVIQDLWAQTGTNPDGATRCGMWAYEGYWCTSGEGCNCHPNEATMVGPGGWVWLIGPQSGVNPYWVCDAAVPNNGDSLPTSCGKTCRKRVLEDWYKNTQVEAWFDYSVHENSGKDTNVQMKSGDNVLPLETPWNFLHAGAVPAQHFLKDETTKFAILLNYTAQHSLVREPLAQSCIWYGCSADQYCDWVDLYDICDNGYMYVVYMDCPSPCGECENVPGYPKHFTMQFGDETVDCWTIFKWKDCVRCWGAWHQWACSYPVSDEDPAGGYHKAMPDVLEEINDTSTVSARPYGDHLTTSRPLGEPNSHASIRLTGYLDYKWGSGTDKLDFRKFRVNASLKVSALDRAALSQGKREDLLGGFELLIPDSLMVSFIAKDYMPIHDLFILDSTLPREKIYINEKMQEQLHIKKCGYEQTDKNYIHFVINPMKKYYYAAQGKATKQGGSRVFFSAIGEVYSWDVTLVCDPGGWFRDPAKEQIGMFRNFHEDEPKYWDFVGFYPQYKDLNTTEFSLIGNQSASSETFTAKETPEEESEVQSKIGYNYNTREYTFNFSTQTIASEKFEDSRLRVYSDFRYIEIHPFRTEAGQTLSCTNDHISETIGGVTKDIYMRHPVELKLEKGEETNTTVSFKIKGTDLCGGAEPTGEILIKFNFPYTEYSSTYGLGESVTVEKRSKRVTFTVEYVGSTVRYQSAIQGFEIETKYTDIFDYIYENFVVIVIAFIALMSYRFFSSKRMDIQEMWDEWKGKK